MYILQFFLKDISSRTTCCSKLDANQVLHYQRKKKKTCYLISRLNNFYFTANNFQSKDLEFLRPMHRIFSISKLFHSTTAPFPFHRPSVISRRVPITGTFLYSELNELKYNFCEILSSKLTYSNGIFLARTFYDSDALRRRPHRLNSSLLGVIMQTAV